MKMKMTAAKNSSHTFQPTPVRSAINSILFIVPRRRSLVESKLSFIFSARAEESRISSPMATVIYTPSVSYSLRVFNVETYILESLDFAQDTRDLRIILALELVKRRIAILSPTIRRRGSVPRRSPVL